MANSIKLKMRKLPNIILYGVSCALALLMLPQSIYALGLGKLEVESGIGQPLKLVVPVTSVTEEEAETLDVSLASVADFKRAGLDYPVIAEELEFELIPGERGDYSLEITTLNPIQETFLHLLVSASWSGGKALREYTALIDPPLYTGEQASGIIVAGVKQEPSASGVTGQPSTVSASNVDEIVVRKGDTLSHIVGKINKPADVDYYQALYAIYQENPDAFINNNMNLVRNGARLKIPSFDNMRGLSRSESIASFSSQLDQFNRLKKTVPTQSSESIANVGQSDTRTTEVEQATSSDVTTKATQNTASSDASLEIVQDVDEQLLADADPLTQAELIQQQIAQLKESLLAAGVEGDAVSENLKQLESQAGRASGLIAIEDSNLASVQNQESDPTIEPVTENTMVAPEEENAMIEAEQAISENIESVEPIITADTDETDKEEEVTTVAALVPTPSTESINSNSSDTVSAESSNSVATSTAEAVVETQATPAVQTPVKVEPEPQVAVAPALTPRKVADTGILSSITGFFSGIFSSISGLFSGTATSLAVLLLAALGGIFFWQRRKSRIEFDESMMDMDDDEFADSEVSEVSVQKVNKKSSKGSGIDLASAGDSALELTIGGGMSYLSEGMTGTADEDNEVIQAGAVDPLAEADVYLAYDRDEQAIQVLKEAYVESPERGELAEKLLEIYHKQDDTRSFDALANELNRRRDTTLNLSWDKVVAMGLEVNPDNPLYSGGGAAVSSDNIEMDFNDDMVADIGSSDTGLVSMDADSGLDMLTPTLGADSGNLELDDLDMDIEIDKAMSTVGSNPIDAPTLSQMVSDQTSDISAPDLSMNVAEEKAEDLLAGDDLDFDLGGDLDLDDNLGSDSGLDMKLSESNISLDVPSELEPLIVPTASDAMELDADPNEIELDVESTNGEGKGSEPYQESETALELAKAYMELGEQDIAKGFIEEVLNDGSEAQRNKARSLIGELNT